jgi:hypothetical protein
MLKKGLLFIALLFVFSSSFSLGYSKKTAKKTTAIVNKATIISTFGSPPKLPNGSISYTDLLIQLKDLKATTYNWLLLPDPKCYDQFKAFLPLAKAANIDVWVTLLPPTELKDVKAEYNTDLKKWAKDLATLSLTYNNLKAWCIDDFDHNLKFYTPQYVADFQMIAKKINPQFKFVPVCYYKGITEKFVLNYSKLIDGIVFPYRNESAVASLKEYKNIDAEIQTIKLRFDKPFLIIVDVYSSRHSTLGESSIEFVDQVIKASILHTDGVNIYRHPNPKVNAEKYSIIKSSIANSLLLKK